MIEQFYLIKRWRPNRYYQTESERTTLSRAAGLQPVHQMLFSVMSRTLVKEWSNPSAEVQPQPTYCI